MNLPATPETLHRTAKAMMDGALVDSLADAVRHLEGLRLHLDLTGCDPNSPTRQAAVLTAVTCARRCFLGGVTIAGLQGIPLSVDIGGCSDLAAAVACWGARADDGTDAPSVCIAFGDRSAARHATTLRPTFNGWTGAVLGNRHSERLPETQENILTGVFIGAAAVAEAFQHATSTNVFAGRRNVGLSLWDPRPETDWRSALAGPELQYLPSGLWLIGLGHLGQAYLWTLGMLPYAKPGDVQLMLQDFDRIVPANDSTSPLTTLDLVGMRKTRAMAAICEQRGFDVRLVERPFGPDLRIAADDPRVALCGVDNAIARSLLEGAGFDLVVEAGLGKGWNDYLDLQVHTFPSQVSATAKWQQHQMPPPVVPRVASYQHLAAEGLDDCGLLQLATRSVGAAFVGCTTAALVVGELLRVLHGGQRHALIDASLRDLTCRAVVAAAGPASALPRFARARRV